VRPGCNGRMKGARYLTRTEERQFIRSLKSARPQDRMLALFLLYTGFRMGESLTVTIGQVVQDGRIADFIWMPVKFMKRSSRRPRFIPVGTRLRRELEDYLVFRSRQGPLVSDEPLFVGAARHEGRRLAYCSRHGQQIVTQLLRRAISGDARLLTSHTFRKTWARRLYEASGHDLLLVREGLGHTMLDTTERYLDSNRSQLNAFILKRDRTREQRPPIVNLTVVTAVSERRDETPAAPLPEPRHEPMAWWVGEDRAIARAIYLQRLSVLRREAIRLFGELRIAEKWIKEPQPLLNDQSPMALLWTEAGDERVHEALALGTFIMPAAAASAPSSDASAGPKNPVETTVAV
jgi:hypothetical protein